MPTPQARTEGGLTLRAARPEDREPLARLIEEEFTHYWGPYASAASDADATAEALLSGNSGCVACVADRDASLVAFATVTLLHPAPTPAGALFMKDLYVTAGHRGDAIGEKMMAWLSRFARDLGCARFDWTAEAPNTRAVSFYDRLGAPRAEDKIYFRLSGPSLAEAG